MERIISTTNELEKQFFDMFGIEPKKGCTAYDKFIEEVADLICNDKCAECSYLDDVYPQITSDRLLELTCVLTRFYGELVLEQCLDVKDLKEQVLNIFIRTSYKDNFKHQVRKLFKEER